MVGRRALRGTQPFGSPAPEAESPCPLCGRPMLPGASADEHHLVPVSQGGREKTRVHRICHRKIHATFSEKELAREFHSWGALRAHPEIAAFVRWVANKPPGYFDRSVRPNRRR